MTSLVDARPRGLNLLFRPGTTLTVEMTWPTGELDGRVFTSTLNAVALAVTVDGDVMTVEASAAQTETFAVGIPADWVLLEDLGGDDPEPLIIGDWVADLDAAVSHTASVVITDGVVTVNVSVFTGGLTTAALATHAATALDAGVHGIVERNWAQDGTTGLTRQVMTQDGSNGVSASVSDGFGVFTALGTGDGQHEAWKLADTNWADSEMTSLLGHSDLFGAPPNAAQWGHFHRIQDQGGGTWKAFAVWTDVQFTIPPILNIGVASWNGTTLTFQIINALEWANMLRHLPIHRAKRVSNVSTYWTQAPWIRSLAVGNTGDVSGMAVAGFDQATTAITAIDLTQRSFSLANTGANATDADAGGVFSPTAPHSTLPMMLSTRLVGNTIQAKQWRPEESEPDWSDTRFVFTNAVVGGTPSPHSGLGVCGLWVAHLQTPNKLRYGTVRCRKL